MEHRCTGSDEANTRIGAHPMPPREDSAWSDASLRTGQMVSRRTAATLGAELLLAQRRRPGLGECRSHRARRSGLRLRCGSCSRVHEGTHSPPSGERRKRVACLQHRSRIVRSGWLHFAHSPPAAGWPVVLVEPVVVSSPGALIADAGRLAYWLSHTD